MLRKNRPSSRSSKYWACFQQKIHKQNTFLSISTTASYWNKNRSHFHIHESKTFHFQSHSQQTEKFSPLTFYDFPPQNFLFQFTLTKFNETFIISNKKILKLFFSRSTISLVLFLKRSVKNLFLVKFKKRKKINLKKYLWSSDDGIIG